MKTTDSLIEILKSNNIAAEERNIKRIKSVIENLNQELCEKELKLEKMKRGLQGQPTELAMQVTEAPLLTT